MKFKELKPGDIFSLADESVERYLVVVPNFDGDNVLCLDSLEIECFENDMEVMKQPNYKGDKLEVFSY